jgi:hypothetical protein
VSFLIRSGSKLPGRRLRLEARAASYLEDGWQVLEWTGQWSVRLGRPKAGSDSVWTRLFTRFNHSGKPHAGEPVNTYEDAYDDFEYWNQREDIFGNDHYPNTVMGGYDSEDARAIAWLEGYWKQALFVGVTLALTYFAVTAAGREFTLLHGLAGLAVGVVAVVLLAAAGAVYSNVTESLLYERIELAIDPGGVIHELPVE